MTEGNYAENLLQDFHPVMGVCGGGVDFCFPKTGDISMWNLGEQEPFLHGLVAIPEKGMLSTCGNTTLALRYYEH